MINLEKKKAQTEIEILSLIKNRWSPRGYSDKEVSDESLRKIFEAARWAPSSANEQPWRFILGKKGTQSWQKIFDCLDDGNRTWNQYVPVLIMTVAKKTFARNGKPNKHFYYDLGQSVAYLTLQATEQGLYVHQMAGFYPDKAQEIFSIPDDYEAVSCIAIGYLGNTDLLNEKHTAQELAVRTRHKLEDLVFTDTWGNAKF